MEINGILQQSGKQCVVGVAVDDTIGQVKQKLCEQLIGLHGSSTLQSRMGLCLQGSDSVLDESEFVSDVDLECGGDVEVVTIAPQICPTRYVSDTQVTRICLSTCGAFCVIAEMKGILTVWSTETGQKIREISNDTDATYGIAVSAGASRVVSGNFNATICVWDVETADIEHILTGHDLTVLSLAVSHCGDRLVSTSLDKSIRTWRLSDGTALGLMEDSDSYATCVTLCDTLVVSGTYDSTVRVWCFDTLKCLRVLVGHTAPVKDVAVTDCQRYAVSVSSDKTTRVWSLHTGEQQHTFSTTFIPRAVCVGGGKAAVISGDSIIVWDVESGERHDTVVEGARGQCLQLSICGKWTFRARGFVTLVAPLQH